MPSDIYSYADTQKYECERIPLKQEALRLLQIANGLAKNRADILYFLAREEAEFRNNTEAFKLIEQSVKLDK